MKTGAPSRSLAIAEPWAPTNLSSSVSLSALIQRWTEIRFADVKDYQKRAA
jgi:hypothetical protein